MSDNMMPGDNSGAEPREHYPCCASMCEHADIALDPDNALRRFMGIAATLSWWSPEHFFTDPRALLIRTKNDMSIAAALTECPMGHRSHDCNCEDIANSDDPWDE